MASASSVPSESPLSTGPRLQRVAAARATAALLASPLQPRTDCHNFPPRDLSSYAAEQPGQQFYWAPEAWEVGLTENCKLLHTYVHVSQVLPGGRAGLGLFTLRAFAEGETIGYLWGRFATQEEWDSIKKQGKELGGRWPADRENFVAPVQRGVHRCVRVAQQETGATLLLASEQCPMAYVNHGRGSKERNAVIVFPAHRFSEQDQPAYQYLAFVVRTHDQRGIAEGEEILTD